MTAKSVVKRYKHPIPPIMQSLESRQLLSVAPVYYSLNGTGNNLAHANWGGAGVDLLRKSGTAYGDGISTMAGATRPNPRELSNVLGTQVTDPEPNSRNMSDMIYAWGQFIDHDLDLTPTGGADASITVPANDTVFTPGSVIPATRSITDPNTGTSTENPLLQPNTITAFLDGSMIYGSNDTRALALRTLTGGLMKTSAGDLLPINTGNLPEEIHIPGTDPTTLFAAGDIRVNENSELAALSTLFLREHNYWANQFATANPTWTDQMIYDHARQRVIAEIQAITYNQFLPAMLGTKAVHAYTGYNSKVNPGIAAEFSAAAYRVGHTFVNGNIDFFNDDGSESHDPVDFNASADDPAVLQGGTGFVGSGVDAIMKYLVADNAQEGDNQFEDALRNQLFLPGNASAGGSDLYSLDVQRGRDLGLPDYNTVRAAYGLLKVTSFNQITSDATVQGELRTEYGTHTDSKGHTKDNVDNIDLMVGGLSENHAPGGSVGVLFTRIIADQFQRTRDGDRLWYQRTFSGADLAAVQATTLSDVIARNTSITNLQKNAFIFSTGSITGTVFLDKNSNGVQDANERGVGGQEVLLLDSTSKVVSTTHTASDGSYHFDNLAQDSTFNIFTYSKRRGSTTGTLKSVDLVNNSGAGEFGVNFGEK